MLASKVYESYVLNWAGEQVKLKVNQYGGIKGSSTAHVLLNIVQDICENTEDYRAATVITLIDYAKAFNRLSFQHCLRAFAGKGASNQILPILATFLRNRSMTVRVGTSWLKPKQVSGGCPQGSILGVFLFNTRTDDLEDDFLRSQLGIQDDWSPIDGVGAHPRNVGRDRLSPPIRDRGPSASSTPVRMRRHPSNHEDVHEHLGLPFVFTAAARNVPIPPPRVEPPEEPNHWTRAVWRPRRVRCCKYVDDEMTTKRVNFENARDTSEVAGNLPVRVKHAVPSQNAFNSTSYNATLNLVRVAPDCNRSYCEDSFSGYSGSV